MQNLWEGNVRSIPMLGLLLLGGCPTPNRSANDAQEVAAVLDDWHRAASVADAERYFGHFTKDGIFIGTDADERWTVEQFRAYARPHFDEGKGWTYRPRDRHIAFGPQGRVAWCDEKLDNDKYGEARGTAVLVRSANTWKLAHYTMSFPIPNAITGKVIGLIRALPNETGTDASAAP